MERFPPPHGYGPGAITQYTYKEKNECILYKDCVFTITCEQARSGVVWDYMAVIQSNPFFNKIKSVPWNFNLHGLEDLDQLHQHQKHYFMKGEGDLQYYTY